MEIKSVRAKIRSIAEKWRKGYCNPPREDHFINQKHVMQIYKELAAINVETATAADVSKIIGNSSWTGNVCNECGFSANVLMQLGEEPDYESHTANICYGCLCEAVNLLGKEI